MQDISTNTHTVIKDSRGRVILVVADTLSGVAIGETIPDGTLGWDKDSGNLLRYAGGLWGEWIESLLAPTFEPLNETGIVNVSSSVTLAYTDVTLGDASVEFPLEFPASDADGVFIVDAYKIVESTLFAGNDVNAVELSVGGTPLTADPIDVSQLATYQVSQPSTAIVLQQSDFPISLTAAFTDVGEVAATPTSGSIIVTIYGRQIS